MAASLRAAPAGMREGVQRLFELLAVFPEDVMVPVAAIDAARLLRDWVNCACNAFFASSKDFLHRSHRLGWSAT